jgi:hypothetical protein
MEPRLQRMRADALAANGQWDEAQKMEDIAWQAMKNFMAQRIRTPCGG